MFWLLCTDVWLDSSQPNKGLDLSWYYLKRNSTKQLDQNRALLSQQFSICKQRQSTYSIKIPSKPQPDLSGPERWPVAFVQDMNINHTHSTGGAGSVHWQSVQVLFYTNRCNLAKFQIIFCSCIQHFLLCVFLGFRTAVDPGMMDKSLSGPDTYLDAFWGTLDGTIHINQCTLFLLENTVVHKHKPFFIITTNC